MNKTNAHIFFWSLLPLLGPYLSPWLAIFLVLTPVGIVLLYFPAFGLIWLIALLIGLLPLNLSRFKQQHQLLVRLALATGVSVGFGLSGYVYALASGKELTRGDFYRFDGTQKYGQIAFLEAGDTPENCDQLCVRLLLSGKAERVSYSRIDSYDDLKRGLIGRSFSLTSKAKSDCPSNIVRLGAVSDPYAGNFQDIPMPFCR
ncbi:hypothetical protein E1162_02965 [Rhodobacteraceae bacterium RKSG542]|uniref:hypothetical protein n=1 Tax=Pseudovibrio flavus TaxID=2529854 RepID=UPI0012BCB1B6|nr:hypothetical protein [Pseudovibrio flavus]MTI16196.1 hypothetical protein [Pseudovibrio flavus]